MKITRKTHQQIRLQNVIFNVLLMGLFGLFAWLSVQFSWQSDWTASQRNSLSEASIQVITRIQEPITITAFASENELIRQRISQLVAQYQRHKSDINLGWVNPDLRPDLARENGITTDGQIIIEHLQQRESVTQLTEQTLTNALQRVTQTDEQWVVFLTGHGERSPFGEANFDYGVFAQELKKKGINSQIINLIDTPEIPRNTSLLVVADPRVALIDGEIKLLGEYIERSGALLVLSEPDNASYLTDLIQPLGIKIAAGKIVDATTQLFGINDPTYALITEYPHHQATQHLQTMSLFPGASALSITPTEPYDQTVLLKTLERSWTETSSIEGDIQYDPNTEELKGPLTIGVALEKNMSNGEPSQRIAMVGDSDFLSNAFLGNGANLDLGLSLIQWLIQETDQIHIPAKTAVDQQLALSNTWSIVFGIGFLVVLPLLLIGAGIAIWYRRKRR